MIQTGGSPYTRGMAPRLPWLLPCLVLLLGGCAKARSIAGAEDTGAATPDAPAGDLGEDTGQVARLDLGDLSGLFTDLSLDDATGMDGPAMDGPALDLPPPVDGCTPECAGKCAGDKDGCGQLCPVNQCAGCCQGTVCKAGSVTSECGASGSACKDCTFSGDCTVGACVAGACTTQKRPDGISCPNGRCYNGTCCTGCWDGGSCRGGISGQYCGSKGVTCATCQTSNPCKTATCNNGNCVQGQRPFGWGCPGGKCLHGSCCTGCIGNSTCHPGNTNGNCGNWGGPCQACWSPKWCSGGNCIK